MPNRGSSPRNFIKQVADAYGVSPSDALLQSRRRDAMWKGTESDHAKAQWFAKYWRQAVDGRDEERIHVRGVHYFIYQHLEEDVAPPTNCSWDVYENTTRCADYLQSAAALARVLGYIPMDGIIDERNDVWTITEYDDHRTEFTIQDIGWTPDGVHVPGLPEMDETARLQFSTKEDLARYVARKVIRQLNAEFHIDHASVEPFHVELWSEKTLPDEVKDEAGRYGVNVVVEGQGDLSYSVANALNRRLSEAGKDAVILYLSDFDPKGDNMASAMAGKLAWMDFMGEIDNRVVVEQLAITADQIAANDWPRKPIEGSDAAARGTGGKAYDTLVDEWEQRKGHGAVELNVLETDIDQFRRIVREGVEDLRDDALDEKIGDARQQWRSDLRDVIEEAVLDSDLPEQIEDLQEWADEFNEVLEDAAEYLSELREHRDEGFLSEWREDVEDVITDVEIPSVDVPSGSAFPPSDPLYDSSRDYFDNLRAVTAHKRGER